MENIIQKLVSPKKKTYHISVVTTSRLKVVITLEQILKKDYIFLGILRCQLVVADVSKVLLAFQASITLYRLTRRDNWRNFNFQYRRFEKVTYGRYEFIEYVPRTEHSLYPQWSRLYLTVNRFFASQWTLFYLAVNTVCTHSDHVYTSQWIDFVPRSEHCLYLYWSRLYLTVNRFFASQWTQFVPTVITFIPHNE